MHLSDQRLQFLQAEWRMTKFRIGFSPVYIETLIFNVSCPGFASIFTRIQLIYVTASTCAEPGREPNPPPPCTNSSAFYFRMGIIFVMFVHRLIFWKINPLKENLIGINGKGNQ